MYKIIVLMLGGASGTLLRYLVSGLTQKFLEGAFPWGTLIVNLTGSFLIGLSWGLFEKTNYSPTLRLFLFIGLFGGFTTFSSFTIESLNLIKSGNIRFALFYIGSSNILGLFLVYLGYATARMLQIMQR